jgi:predicted dehydrogenase
MIFYRMNAGYLPPNHWTQTAEGGGRIIGEACHIFDLFQYLVDAPVVEVNSAAITPQTEHILPGDNVTVTLRYADGSVATLFYTALGSPDFGKEYMEIYADGKVLVLEDYLQLRIHGTKMEGLNNSVADKGHKNELVYFAQSIRDGSSRHLSEEVEVTEIAWQVANIQTNEK